MTNQELDPSVEVVHLRRLLDIQPSCLMRLGADGVVLAANNAALTLLGMECHEQTLGRVFTAWIPPDQRDRWSAFIVQVVQGSPASIECDITGPSGHRQTTLLHGVPLTDHPDGLPSIAVAARSVAERRQLEGAMIQHEVVVRALEAERLDARARLGEALADRQQFEAALEEAAARHQRLTTERAAERQHVLETLGAIAIQHRQDLVAAQNAPEWSRLTARLEERDATVRQLEAARAAEQAELEEMLADRLRLEASIREAEARHDGRAAIAAAERARLQQVIDSTAERHQIERQAHERDTQQRLVALQRTEQDARQQCDQLQARLDQAQGACDRIETTLRQQETTHRDLVTEHAATAAERDRLARSLAEQAVEVKALTEHGRQLMRLAFAGRAARDIASRLRQHVERMDDFATGVLVNGEIDGSMRPALERLRGEAVHASALADEFLMAGDGQPAAELAGLPLVRGDGGRS